MSRIATASLVLFLLVAEGLAAPSPKILEKRFQFPSPVQWKTGQFEFSLTGVAWGPANSPKLISKAHLKHFQREKPRFFPDRPYALALRFHVHTPGLSSSEVWGSSRLVLVKNINGSLEGPMELTALGFIPPTGSAIDFHFDHVNTTDFSDYFPASPDRKEFLLQVFGATGLPGYRGRLRASFKVLIGRHDLAVVNVLPGAANLCSDFTKSFSGTIGSSTEASMHLTVQGTTLSGTEEYARAGQNLWLRGRIDSLGNFVLKEHYPKDHLAGIFKGTFNRACNGMSGYFSKPDGSELLPFEFHEEGPAK